MLTTGIGRVANRDFVRSVVTAFGDNRRQTPEFHGEEVLGGRVLLGMATEQAKPGDTAVVPAASGATSVSGELSAMVAAASDDGRAAAIAAFLRATANLLES